MIIASRGIGFQIFGKYIIDRRKEMKVIVLGSTGMLGLGLGIYLLSVFNEDDVFLSYRNSTSSWGCPGAPRAPGELRPRRIRPG